jgi:hypothetical protein
MPVAQSSAGAARWAMRRIQWWMNDLSCALETAPWAIAA